MRLLAFRSFRIALLANGCFSKDACRSRMLNGDLAGECSELMRGERTMESGRCRGPPGLAMEVIGSVRWEPALDPWRSGEH